MRQIIVGTRGNALALAEARQVVARLKEEWPETEFRMQSITGNSGKPISDLEEALLQKRIDIAIHDLKTLPTDIRAGLELAAIPKRVDARDALLGRANFKSFKDLPTGAVVGVSSSRCKAFLKVLRSDLAVQDISGSLESQLTALGHEDFDAVIVAAADLIRMDLRNRIDDYLDPLSFLPAPAQGALALQTRDDDDLVIEVAYSINDASTDDRITAERSVLAALGLSADAAVGALATLEKGRLKLDAAVAARDGSGMIRGSIEGEPEECEDLGAELAEDLLKQGAKNL